jgi:glycine/D-amino acid oxidase-like deaminating enzyme
MYDAIVIGARCAGAPTAMLLARKGHKVLLLDKSTFPSEIAHGHFIHRQGPKLLARWGSPRRYCEIRSVFPVTREARAACQLSLRPGGLLKRSG